MKKILILFLFLTQILISYSQDYKIPRKSINPTPGFISSSFIENNTIKETINNNIREKTWRNKFGIMTAKIVIKYDNYGNEKEHITKRYKYGFLVFKQIYKYDYRKVSGYKTLVTISEFISYNKLGSVIEDEGHINYYDRNFDEIYKYKIAE